MKQLKLSALLIVLLSISFGLKAQDKFGIRGGFQTGNVYNSGSLYDNNLNTFYVGVFKEFKVVPLIKFDAGIDFNQNGSLNDSMSIKLSYISVPLNAKIKIGPIYGLVGAAPAFKVAEKWKLNDQTVDIDKFKSNFFDVPVFVGVGFKVSFISIEARYYIGTMSINDNAISGLQDYKSQYLQLGLALSI